MNNKEDSIVVPDLRIRLHQTGTVFTSPTTTFGNGTTSNRESAGVDAQYGAA